MGGEGCTERGKFFYIFVIRTTFGEVSLFSVSPEDTEHKKGPCVNSRPSYLELTVPK